MQEQKHCCCGGGKSIDYLDAILDKYKGYDGALIPVLQQAQHAHGYLSKEVLEYISKHMNIPMSQIYGVATFYSQFHLNPRGENIIKVCQGTACHVRGGKQILEKIESLLGVKAGETTKDLKFTLETVACIGACGLAPVIMINEDTHGRLTPDAMADIIKQYE